MVADQTSTHINVFWFRRDLRLNDNRALDQALNSGLPVLPIFIYDSNILENLNERDGRIDFIFENLQKINSVLKAKGSGLAMFYGKPAEVFSRLTEQYMIATVFTNRDYEPYARDRDTEVEKLLKQKGVSFKTFKDQVIFEKNEVVKPDGEPYVVYTPYMKKWKEVFKSVKPDLRTHTTLSDNFFRTTDLPEFSPYKQGFEASGIKVRPYSVTEETISGYNGKRNYPGIDGTSSLSPHLRFGTVSIREIVQLAMGSDDETFLNELIWREFFMQILWHFPETVTRSFKDRYDAIKWRNNEIEFRAWCEGRTGYPLVDAGMRELNATGYMHNRIRMVTASFLCKHLLIDWRWGEAYFAEKLLDYEMSSNIGNWQWVAGCGVDAAPYFRIFNPTEQLKKFDKEMIYVKKWVPEIDELSYPAPIVDHKAARQRCLETYAIALNN